MKRDHRWSRRRPGARDDAPPARADAAPAPGSRGAQGAEAIAGEAQRKLAALGPLTSLPGSNGYRLLTELQSYRVTEVPEVSEVLESRTCQRESRGFQISVVAAVRGQPTRRAEDSCCAEAWECASLRVSPFQALQRD